LLNVILFLHIYKSCPKKYFLKEKTSKFQKIIKNCTYFLKEKTSKFQKKIIKKLNKKEVKIVKIEF